MHGTELVTVTLHGPVKANRLREGPESGGTRQLTSLLRGIGDALAAGSGVITSSLGGLSPCDEHPARPTQTARVRTSESRILNGSMNGELRERPRTTHPEWLPPARLDRWPHPLVPGRRGTGAARRS